MKGLLPFCLFSVSSTAFAFEKVVNIDEYLGRHQCVSGNCVTIPINERIMVGENGIGVNQWSMRTLRQTCSRALSERSQPVQFSYIQVSRPGGLGSTEVFQASTLTCTL